MSQRLGVGHNTSCKSFPPIEARPDPTLRTLHKYLYAISTTRDIRSIGYTAWRTNASLIESATLLFAILSALHCHCDCSELRFFHFESKITLCITQFKIGSENSIMCRAPLLHRMNRSGTKFHES